MIKCSFAGCGKDATGTAWQAYHKRNPEDRIVILLAFASCERHQDMLDPIYMNEYNREWGYLPGTITSNPRQVEQVLIP